MRKSLEGAGVAGRGLPLAPQGSLGGQDRRHLNGFKVGLPAYGLTVKSEPVVKGAVDLVHGQPVSCVHEPQRSRNVPVQRLQLDEQVAGVGAVVVRVIPQLPAAYNPLSSRSYPRKSLILIPCV